MRVIMLHGVVADEAPALDRQLAWLRRHFEPVALSELLARLDEPERITGREVALTFDDGLRNNATVVAPLLRKHGVPATFFVCPALIEQQAWLWNHEARERLRSLGEVHPSATVEAMKTLSLPERQEADASLRARTPDFAPTTRQREAFDMMSWDELLALDPQHVTIGSHTLDHPILPTLDEAAIDEQLAGSRALLEDKLQQPVPLFCYPNGSEDDRVRSAARKHYDAAVTTVPGLVRPAADRHGLPRIGATDGVPELAWRFHRP